MNYLPDGTLIPNLITEVPSIENGLLSQDLRQVTYKILPGIEWSDGKPFTAADVRWTWQWIANPDNASVSYEIYKIIEAIETPDDLTAVVTFAAPAANWFEPHAGSIWGPVYPQHVLDLPDPRAAHDAFLQKPIGTGPFLVESFAPGDQVIYVANPNYREPNKPYFERVNLKGGGDAASAARAVLQTGGWDYAWNLQVEPAVLNQLAEGGQGRVVTVPGTNVERININFSDPTRVVEGQLSYWKTEHPFFRDEAVRRALALAVPRDVIAERFYGEGEPATANILVGIPLLTSDNTSWEFNLEKAAQLLEEAGWTMQGDVRAKDGVELNMTYATSVNAVRQRTQAVVKDALEEIGFKVQLQQVDSGVFFDGSPGNVQNINHMYTDVNMYTNGATSPIPVSYMTGWYAGPDGRNIAQESNAWNGQNYQRYQNPEYDRLFEEALVVTDLERAAELFIRMNDILIEDVAVVPIVNRAADKYAIANTLNEENIAMGPFEVNYWNIANWRRLPG